jgi:hypothetical protein
LRLDLRQPRAHPRFPSRALVLHSRGTDGPRRNHPQLEQELASLVLAILAAHLAHKLLDRPETPREPSAGCPLAACSKG